MIDCFQFFFSFFFFKFLVLFSEMSNSSIFDQISTPFWSRCLPYSRISRGLFFVVVVVGVGGGGGGDGGSGSGSGSDDDNDVFNLQRYSFFSFSYLFILLLFCCCPVAPPICYLMFKSRIYLAICL